MPRSRPPTARGGRGSTPPERGYLAKLPVDTLKIDRSFVIDMTAAPEGLSLASTIINLARSLKLKVAAEIFETKFLAPPLAG